MNPGNAIRVVEKTTPLSSQPCRIDQCEIFQLVLFAE